MNLFPVLGFSSRHWWGNVCPPSLRARVRSLGFGKKKTPDAAKRRRFYWGDWLPAINGNAGFLLPLPVECECVACPVPPVRVLSFLGFDAFWDGDFMCALSVQVYGVCVSGICVVGLEFLLYNSGGDLVQLCSSAWSSICVLFLDSVWGSGFARSAMQFPNWVFKFHRSLDSSLILLSL